MAVALEQTFAEVLRSLRLAAGLSQYELAKRSGLTKQAISSLENGTNQPSWDSVKKLARGLGLPVGAFDISSSEPNPEPAGEAELPPLPPDHPPRRTGKKK